MVLTRIHEEHDMGKKVLRIRQVIGARCLKLREAAEMCGLSPQAFGRIVNGKEPAYSRRGARIARALGWEGDPAELFEEIEVS